MDTLIRNGTVLLVNDDVNARIIEQTLLEARGLPVHAVGDGHAAYDVVAQEGFRVAVMVLSLEINAAGMSGWQLLHRLRAEFEAVLSLGQLRVVVTTARQDRATAPFVHWLSDAVLRRPIAPCDFIAVVERLRASAMAAMVAHSLHPVLKLGAVASAAGSER